MITSQTIFDLETQGQIVHILHWIAATIEMLGIAVIVLGIVAANVWSAAKICQGQWNQAFRSYRANLGRGIVLGLEFPNRRRHRWDGRDYTDF